MIVHSCHSLSPSPHVDPPPPPRPYNIYKTYFMYLVFFPRSQKCTIIDKGIIRATLLGGLDPETAKRTEAELSSIGAMPTRRHFLPRKRKFNKIRRATSKGGGRSA